MRTPVQTLIGAQILTLSALKNYDNSSSSRLSERWSPKHTKKWTDLYAPKVFTPGHSGNFLPLPTASLRGRSANLLLSVGSIFILKYMLKTLLLPVVI